jgi:Ser/Thr protein kinase RdoA (MazF antagonist)
VESFNRTALRKLVTSQKVEQVLAQYFSNPPVIRSCKVNNRGKNNQVYKVVTDRDEFILHLYNPLNNIGLERAFDDFAYAFAFQDAVTEAGVPIPRRYRTLAGENLGQIELGSQKYYLTLHQFMQGRSHWHLTNEQISALAQAMAWIHTTAEQLKLEVPSNRAWSTNSYIEENELTTEVTLPSSNGAVSLQAYLTEFLAITRQARGYIAQNLKHLSKYPVHGDICGPNLLYQDNQLVAILDFDNCHHDYLYEDLSVPLLVHCTFTEAKRTLEKVTCFLENYAKTRNLSQLELDLSLQGLLGFQAWYAHAQLLKQIKDEASFDQHKLLKTAETSMRKIRASQETIKSLI